MGGTAFSEDWVLNGYNGHLWPAVYLSGSAYPKWSVPLMHELLRITLAGEKQIPGAWTN